MPGKPKGLPKTGGRKPGTPNKTTEKARELFTDILANQVSSGKVESALDEIYEESKLKYLAIFEKLAKYFTAQKLDVTSKDEQLEGFIVKSVSDADRNDSK